MHGTMNTKLNVSTHKGVAHTIEMGGHFYEGNTKNSGGQEQVTDLNSIPPWSLLHSDYPPL